MATGIFLPIVSQFIDKGLKQAVKELESLKTTQQKAAFAISKAALPAAAALTGLTAGAFKAAQAAGDLAEEQSKVGVVFGTSSQKIIKFSERTARTIGQSQQAALEAAGTFGTLGKAAGLSGDGLADFTIEFTELASDLASFNNTTPEDAIQAIGAALRGEAEPLRRYGVLLDDATLRQKALELGLINTTKQALTPQNKSLAAQAVILEQTKDAQGDFERTSKGAANQQRILEAQIKDSTAQLGRAFLPAMQAVLPLLVSMASIVGDNAPLFVGLGIAFGGFAAAILAAKAALVIWNAISVITTAINTALAISFTAVQVATVVGIATAVAGAATIAVLAVKIKSATSATNAYAGATGAAATETGFLKNQIDQAAAAADKKAAADTAASRASDEAAVNAKARAEELKRTIAELRKSIKGDFSDALSTARDVLKQAQTEFANYASTVANSITSAFSFGEAKKAAEETGKTFLQALEAQVKKVRDYSVLVNRLIAAGLNESALSQVLAAGQDAGTAIATELLNGGAAAITQANALSAEVATLGTNVGNNAAVQFKTAGVTAAQGLIAGIESVISSYQLKLKSKKLTAKQLTNLRKNFGVDVDFVLSGGTIPALANGGIVRASSGGTLALIGEGGQDEAVIPLDRLNGTSGGPTIIIQGAVDPISTARQIEKILSGQSSRFGY
jgi:hypothetical protein